MSAAILAGGEVLAHRFEPRTRGHAEALMPMIGAVLEEARLGMAGLGALAVTIGPGTFTGLRVGLAAARGIALARALPLVGVTTLEAIAAPVEAHKGEAIAAAFDARREEIYFQLFDEAHAPLTGSMLIALNDAVTRIPPSRPLVLAGTGAALLADALAVSGMTTRLAQTRAQPDALWIARIAARELAAHGPDRFRAAPAPLYLRAPDAKLPGGIALAEAGEGA